MYEGLHQIENATLTKGFRKGVSVQDPSSNMVYLEYPEPSLYLSIRKWYSGTCFGSRQLSHTLISKKDIEKLGCDRNLFVLSKLK